MGGKTFYWILLTSFFFGSGVLDPLELSLISGNISKSSGEMLSVINEGRRESLVGELEDLGALEENCLGSCQQVLLRMIERVLVHHCQRRLHPLELILK